MTYMGYQFEVQTRQRGRWQWSVTRSPDGDYLSGPAGTCATREAAVTAAQNAIMDMAEAGDSDGDEY